MVDHYTCFVCAMRRLMPTLAALCCVLASASAAANTKPAEKHPGMRAFAAEMAPDDAAAQQRILALLDQAEYQNSIIKAMTRPAEKTKSWADYRPIFMTDKRIDGGRDFYLQHAELLTRVSADYGVPAEIIVAIIGVETFYGRITGSYKVLDALTTLAFYYPPRSAYFTGELKRFIGLPNERGVALALNEVKGSYAGAMGWGQFMPTSYATWAVDDDQDGRIDLWGSERDICASIANYLVEHGWERDGPISMRLNPIPGAREIGWDGAQPVYPLSQLVEWGYQPEDVLDPDRASALLTLQGAAGSEHFATFENFRVITTYNRSPMYAMAVTQLAAAIADQVRAAQAAVSAAQ